LLRYGFCQQTHDANTDDAADAADTEEMAMNTMHYRLARAVAFEAIHSIVGTAGIDLVY